MKPLEILSALPLGARARADDIVDSPAFAMPCRLGEESVEIRRAPVEPSLSEALALSVAFGDEPHALYVARAPRFPDLDKVWDSRGEMPEAVLLALVEKECGALFQALENAVRKQLRLLGVSPVPPAAADEAPETGGLAFFRIADVSFALTRSATVVSAFGVLRNLDLSHASIRSQELAAEVEYAAFALPADDLASLAPGDAVLLPEVGSMEPKLIVAERFVLGAEGVSAYADDARVRAWAAEGRPISLGEVFDAVETPPRLPHAGPGAQLRLVRGGMVLAAGRLDRLGDQHAFIVESTS